MHKLLLSLLCCVTETKDPDKVVSHTLTPTDAKKLAPARSTKVGAAAAADHAIQKDRAAASEIKSSPPPVLMSKTDDADSTLADTVTNDDHKQKDTKETNPETKEQAPVPEVVTAHATDRSMADADTISNATAEMQEIDPEYQGSEEDDMLDLTKLQTGQAYNPETGALLGPQPSNLKGRKCLILDLDETLVHSSFKYLRTADFVIPVEIDNQVHHVYVIKRPGVDGFLKRVGELFEVVVFTALVQKYGDPLLDKLDVHHAVHHRLYRDLCYNYQGNFIKNLSQVGRPLRDTIIIDNLPTSYIFHPQHLIPILLWFSDTHDNELLDLLPILEDLALQNVDDIGLVLDITL